MTAISVILSPALGGTKDPIRMGFFLLALLGFRMTQGINRHQDRVFVFCCIREQHLNLWNFVILNLFQDLIPSKIPK
ncbi:hypothetical protein COT52_00960 [candidate division WWE3 bacterium CG08_land_8_20_14_0_20_43_13]|uniref:Uncharacterized protein n=1 Tax=candidate division WWE3 bacterium CG08_land_8_20_14_0_20_43_13 TaxID=1975087 RepID=A0A2H0XA03_UNCKA|nr:MAG: hypothetical protein COT52_00960 [candidate division WWE3 bacterium CG08_land_8_20_14_0_20_43_13]